MKCDICSNEMELDDKDIHSKGNLDKYWICEKCEIGCCEEIRDNVSVNVSWNRN